MEPSVELRAALENLGALKRCLRAAVTEAYGGLQLGEAQLKLLRYVATHPGASQIAAARATDTDPALVGRALRGLLARGALRRRPSKADGRAYVLDLGAGGKALLAQAARANERLVSRVCAPLDTRDLVDFDRIAKKVISALAEAPPAQGGRRPRRRARSPSS